MSWYAILNTAWQDIPQSQFLYLHDLPLMPLEATNPVGLFGFLTIICHFGMVKQSIVHAQNENLRPV